MMAENDQRGAPGGALIAPFAALLIALLGAYGALGERSGSATDVLSLGAVLESERSVRVEGLGEPQIAGLVDAWGRLGLRVGSDVEDPGMRVVFLGASTEAAASRLIRAGFERGPRSGVWRAAPTLNGGVPLVPIVLEGTGRTGGVLLTCVDESAPGRSVTYVIAETADAPVVHRILASLRRGTPPVRPELRAGRRDARFPRSVQAAPRSKGRSDPESCLGHGLWCRRARARRVPGGARRPDPGGCPKAHHGDSRRDVVLGSLERPRH